MNTYFCNSTNLNPELQLVIFSMSLKPICSPAACCKYGNNSPFATRKHTAQNIPTERKGFVESLGKLHNACTLTVLMGEKRVGRCAASRAIAGKTTFWTDSQQEVGHFRV